MKFGKKPLLPQKSTKESMSVGKTRMLAYRLEPRILFDAAAPAVLADVAQSASDNAAYGNNDADPHNEAHTAQADHARQADKAAGEESAALVALLLGKQDEGNKYLANALGSAADNQLADNSGAAASPAPTSLDSLHASAQNFGISSLPTSLAENPGISVGSDPITVNEDTAGDVLKGLTISGSGNLRLTITATHGTLGTGTGSSITLEGTADQINTALQSLKFTGALNYNGDASLSLSLSADAGTPITQTVHFQILQVNDAPTLTPNTPLVVSEHGANVAFTDGQFGLNDVDIASGQQTTNQIIVRIESLPTHGTLYFNGSPVVVGSSFSYDQLSGLAYTHNGSDVKMGDMDGFTVKAFDGAGGETDLTTIQIKLLPVNEAPTISGDLDIFEGQTKSLGDLITIDDEEIGHTDSPENLLITVSNVDDEARGGILFFDANGDGKYTADERISNGDTFKADQLGKLMFYHKGDEPNATAPSFTLTVTDAGGGEGESGAKSITKTFTINVKAVDDDPTLKENRDGNTNGQTNDYFDVGADHNKVITTADLLVYDVDSKNENLVFTLTELPAYGAIQVFVGGKWLNLAVGGRFTQQQVMDGHVRYLHTSNAPAVDTQDSFQFTVRDSELKAWQDETDHTGKEGGIYDGNTANLKVFTFHMLIDPWTGTGPGTPEGDLTLILGGTGGKTSQTYEGHSNTVGTDLLDYQSKTADGSYSLSAAEIVYRLTGIADTGSLQKLVGGNWVTLGLHDSFTQDDVNKNLVRFTHDGNEKFISSFTFSVTDGATVIDGVILNVDTTPVNDAPNASGGNLTAQEGVSGDESSGIVHINGSHMGMTDADGSDKPGVNQGGADSLWFAFSDLPDNGKLQYWNGSAWIDITAGMLSGEGTSTLWLSKDLLSITVGGFPSGIRYVHNGADNTASLTDAFSFVVRDDLAAPGGSLFATGKADPSNSTLDTPNATPGTGDPASHYQGNHLSNVGTVTVAVAAFNDAPLVPPTHDATNPTLPNTLPSGGGALTGANDILYVTEGGTGIITNGLLQAIDSDNTTVQRQFKVTDQTGLYGTLFLNGKALTVGSTFTQDDIDNGFVTYTHDGSENFVGYFNFVVSDGLAETAGRFDIRVNAPLNDLPTISGPSGSLTHDSNADSGLNIGKDIVIGDPDLVGTNTNTNYVQVTVSADHANALLNATLSGSASITGGGSNSLIISGTLADVQATLKSMMFTTTAGVDIDGKVKITVTVDDRLRDADGTLTAGANGGATNEGTKPTVGQDPNVVSKDFFVHSSILNDAPTLTGPTGGLTVVEDAWIAAPGFSIADADAFDTTITVTVSAGHGLLRSGTTGNGVSSLTLTGTLAEINAKLAALEYTGQLDFNGADTITVTVSDGGNTGADGSDTASGAGVLTVTQSITVTPVNDTPTVSGGPSGTPNITTDYLFNTPNCNAITIGDPKDITGTADHTPGTPTDKYRVTITATNGGSGYGTLVLPDGSPLTDSDSDPNIIVIEGTLADINAALEGLKFVADNYNQDATIKLTVKVDDFGNGDPTPGTTPDDAGHTATKDFNLNISSNNDVPSAGSGSDPTGSVTATEDTKLIINGPAGSLIAFADPDTFSSNTNYVIVTVGHGKLNVTTTGLTVEGADSGTLKLTGTLAQINAALATLSYTGNLDYNGADTLTAVYHDNGNSGAPGATDESFTITRDITVTAVNDAPTGTGSVTLPPISEDVVSADNPGKTVEELLSGKFGDAKDNQTVGNPNGSASDSFTGIVIVGNTANATTEGSWQYYNGTNWVDINTNLSATAGLVLAKDSFIRFVPVADYNGTPGGLTVRLVETGGSATTGTTQDVTGNNSGGSAHISDASNQVTIGTSVTPVNDVPTLTVPPAQNTVEDTTLTFSSANSNGITLADKDIGSGSMNITLHVGHGTLQVAAGSGCTVGADGTGNVTLTGTLAQINAALDGLVYTVSADYNGKDVLTISGNDTGAAGDTFNTTVDINVSHVNDAPTGTGTVTLPSIEPSTPEADIAGQTVDALISGKFSDAKDNQQTTGNSTGSTPDNFVGIVIVGNTADATTEGAWQYFDGTNWVDISTTLTDSTGFVLTKDAKIRFVPVEDYTGTPGGLTVRLVENDGLVPPTFTTGDTLDVDGALSGGTTSISDEHNEITIDTSVAIVPPTPPVEPPVTPPAPPVEPPVTPPTPPVEPPITPPAPPVEPPVEPPLTPPTPPISPPTAPPVPSNPVTPSMPDIVSPSYPNGLTPGTPGNTGTPDNAGNTGNTGDNFLPPTPDVGALPALIPDNTSNAPGNVGNTTGNILGSPGTGNFSSDPFRPAFGDPLGSSPNAINAQDNANTLALTLGDNRNMGWNQGEIFELELTDLRYEVGKVTQFQIPPAAVHHTNPSEKLAFDVAQPDGSPLPGWITFDADNRTFSFHPPKGAEQVDIRVVARDEAGNEAETRFSFQPEDKEASGTQSSAEPTAEPDVEPNVEQNADAKAVLEHMPTTVDDIMQSVFAFFTPTQDAGKPAFAEQLRQHSLATIQNEFAQSDVVETAEV